MTHDELLEQIDEAIEMAVYEERLGCGGGWSRGAKALRAVVELHKPYDDGNKLICQACARLIDPWDENCYPCPTIQAIEAELK